jgi:uncharacterized protein with HEPN domain
MSKRDDRLLKDDIISSLNAILEYTRGITYDDFLASRITIDATIRNFEIIGEAANFISDKFKADYPQIEWRKLTDFRNRLIHHYFGISCDIVWEVITKEVIEYLDFLETVD